MIRTLTPEAHRRLDRGPFQARRIHPGAGLGDPDDGGFGGLGLIDHAVLQPGLTVPMHEHRDDEIVSYLRAGSLRHADTSGQGEEVRPDRLMVMNAGSGFSHEESVLGPGETRMLQIFVRPRAAGLPPRVQFLDLGAAASDGRWRSLAGPEGSGAPASLRQDVSLHDARLQAGEALAIPDAPGLDLWLYVFAGTARVGDVELPEHHALLATEGETLPDVIASTDADLVLFRVDRTARAIRAGTLSGQA